MGARMEAHGLAIGTVIGHRFTVERSIGAGGMGVVYRATDLHTGLPVALKLLRGGGHTHEAERFQREIAAVAELRHPAIVAYVAHGRTAEGQPYLAMEWLEGEELGARLRRRRLDVDLSLRLALRVSEALAAAHRHGLVHRDIKPSNIFLRDGEVDRAVLIDFGVDRRLRSDRLAVTRTGVLLGTPEYMAPEQARGQPDVGPAADVFSLGCVLFECLTGLPPFSGEHVTAVLAKILFDEAPRLHELRPDLPPQLDELVARMLTREPDDRLPDGAALHSALRDLPTLGDARRTLRTLAPREAGGEQHFFSLLLASEPTTLAERPTLHAALAPVHDDLTRALEELGADVEPLVDGSLAAAFPPTPGLAPGDGAALAVRAAVFLKERRPAFLVAVATGRGVVSEGIPRGEGIDRAAWLLRCPAPTEHVRIDALTSELVAARFELRAAGPDVFSVLGERTSLDESRPLLGRATPCVGREQELGALEAALLACVDEPSARVAVVRAGPGMGKSRLRHELLRCVGARVPGLDVMFGRADLMRAGAPYGVLASALRQRWGLLAADAPAVQRRKLQDALAAELPAAEVGRAVEFLGDMCGVANPDPGSPLRAALRDPKLMLAQQTAVFVDLLAAACRRGPLLLVLEDLHWGDAPSCDLVDAALRRLVDQPLMVVAFARPELDERFPRLWQARGAQDLRLVGLSRRASERLIHHALARDPGPEQVARLIDQAGGNPLYLEELIRAAAAGKQDVTPDTVLAMMHTRLLRFEPALRRALRAAACFGEVFWRDGLIAALAEERSTADVSAWLAILRDEEIVVRHPISRIDGDEEYAFRHGLLREAAYSMSSAEDRAHDHRRAAEFLERAGDRDPRVLAEHWLRAGDRERAAAYILDAATHSYRACDSVAALALVERGLGCEPAGDVQAALEALAAWLHAWRLEWRQAQTHGDAAIEHARPGSLWWCSAMTGAINLALFSGHLDRFTALADRYLATDPTPDAEVTYVQGLATFVSLYGMLGQRAPAAVAFQRLHAIGERHGHDSGVQAWMAIARSDYHRAVEPDPAAQLAAAQAAARLFVESEDRRNGFFAEVVLGQALCETDRLAADEATLRTALADADRLADGYFITMARIHLAAALVQRSDPALRDEGAELAASLLHFEGASPGYRGWAHNLLAHVQLARGALDSALEHVLLALQAPSTNVLRLRLAAATHMRVLVARGARLAARAVVTAERAHLDRGGLGYAEPPLRLAVAEVLRAAGEPDAAAAELRRVLAAIDERARCITDPTARRCYVDDVPTHASAAALARGWSLTPC